MTRNSQPVNIPEIPIRNHETKALSTASYIASCQALANLKIVTVGKILSLESNNLLIDSGILRAW